MLGGGSTIHRLLPQTNAGKQRYEPTFFHNRAGGVYVSHRLQ